jgi:hypothetical protein
MNLNIREEISFVTLSSLESRSLFKLSNRLSKRSISKAKSPIISAVISVDLKKKKKKIHL